MRPCSFGTEKSEFVVLVGPSSYRKSTPLRMIAGLEDITTGEMRIGDRGVIEIDAGHRDIAMVFQYNALYPQMSGRRNSAYGLRNRKAPTTTIEQEVTEAASMLNLTGHL